MYILGIFIIELTLLFILSQYLTKALSAWFYHVFKNQAVVIHVLSVIFLPGVILHELSHLLTASMLFVPTGEIEFLPEIRGNEVKMGSVSIAQTDPLRRFLIGVAPLLAGLGILFLLFWYFLPSLAFFSWQTAVLLYAVFEISNTMFSSRKDMEGAVGLLGFVVIGGLKWMLSQGDKKGVDEARKTITLALGGLILAFFSFFIINIIGYALGVPLLSK